MLRKWIWISVILVGFTAMASQIILMREFLIVFYGNELSIGFILASWLIWGAMGAWALGRLADKLKSRVALFSLCQLALSILLPLSILTIRSIKLALGVAIGEIISLSPMCLSTFIILGPICATLGFMFSLGCRIYQGESKIPAGQIGKVYVLEAIGSMVGGLLASFLLIRIMPSIYIMAILSLLNLMAASFLQFYSEKRITRPILFGIFSFFLLLNISMWAFKVWGDLNQRSLKRQWKGYALLSSRNSIYGNVSVVKRDIQRSFFNNGLYLYTVPDKLSSEEAVHFCLLEHPNPKKVLLVGGGVGGLLEEILKHPVQKIDYLELDPLIINMARRYLPKEDYRFLDDPRVNVKHLDGRFFIKRTANKYDCVLLHLGDPYTAQLNRYYTVEFFKELKAILAEDGVISFGVTSAENYISDELRDFLRSIYLSLRKVFSDVKIFPGDTAYFLASAKENILTYDYKVLLRRLNQRRIDTKFVREYYLFSKLSSGRVDYIEARIKEEKDVKVNYDFRPISYYYDTIFWTTRFKTSLFQRLLKGINERKIWLAGLSLCCLIFIFGLISIRNVNLYRKAALLAVATTGFAEITFQVVVLLSFQIIYGYVFYKLGVILTSFMIGLALGGWWITNYMPRLKNDRKTFIWTQVSICLYPLILPIFFWLLSQSKNEFLMWLGSNVFFPFLPVVAGFIGGFQFPLANKIYLIEREKIARVAGLSYGVDLFGACSGALLSATFLIPVLGIPKTCLAVAILNFTVLTLLILSLRPSSKPT